ncbi:tetratricopeptide repeat-containing glycosyltransferase family 2 protein [Paenibacillus tyrfis]|uniref:tetratricopeptide repeat-containing glycosyltransferase family 2 protein n=1 Tax=Paenibacillus tyrfis TaxID=1501230 RepID=UPI00209CF736|nr:glycosyltransferase [Paenibacillus tyrfis]MCP1305705.1 glycosyltransferase [Paenibacillus tyrfis]
MIVKDEEELLPRSLTSVAGIASEIVVVDTGSTDRSAAIAREFGASVYAHEWEDDFSKARNQALDVASGDWILVLDADEELAPECLPLLSESLCRSDAFAYALHFVNYYGQFTEYLSFTDSCCRLFRNLPDLRYSGKIHEDIVPALLKRNLTPIPSRITIRHYGYLEDRVRQKRKPQRNASLLAKAIAATPGDSRLQYALGTEYLHMERYSEAMGVFLPLLESLEPSCGFYPDLLLKTALLLRLQRSHDETLRLVEEGLRLFPDFTDLWDLLGDLCAERNEYGLARKAYERSLMLTPRSGLYASQTGSGSFATAYRLGQLQEKLLNRAEALRSYRQALSKFPRYEPAWRRWLELTATEGRWAELLYCLRSWQVELTPQQWMEVVRSLLRYNELSLAQRIREWVPEPALVSLHPLSLRLSQWLIRSKQGDKTGVLAELQGLNEPKERALDIELLRWAIRLDLSAVKEDDRQQLVQDESAAAADERTFLTACTVFLEAACWDGLVCYLRQSEGALRHLPGLLRTPLLQLVLQAPDFVIQAILARCDRDRLSPQELCAYGLLCGALLRWMEATGALRQVQDRLPDWSLPRLALAQVYRSLAFERLGQPPEKAEWLKLSLWLSA